MKERVMLISGFSQLDLEDDIDSALESNEGKLIDIKYCDRCYAMIIYIPEEDEEDED